MSLDLKFIYPDFNFTMDKSSNNKVYAFENFRLDGHNRMLYRGDDEVLLAPKAVETLLALIERRGEILSKDELMTAIWSGAAVEESNLAKYLHILRKTLGNRENGEPFIETYRRRGYRFSGEVRIVEDPQLNGNATDRSAASPIRETRHGNVLKFVERKGEDMPPFEVVPPREAENPTPPETPFLRRPIFTAVAVTAILAAIVLTAAYSRLASSSTDDPATSERRDLTITRLTNGVAPLSATISPKGDHIVYHEQDGNTAHLWLQQTGQSKRVEIVPPMNMTLGGKTFSPDGQFVYFVANVSAETGGELYRVPTLGGTASKVLEGIITPASFSPDGRQMVFQRFSAESGEFSLITAEAVGINEAVLLTMPKERGHLGTPAWSPDGKLIAFSESTPDGVAIKGIDPISRSIRTLSAEIWGNCYRMAWTPDGDGLVFIGTRTGEGTSTRRDQVYFLPLPTGEARRLTTEGNRHQIDSLGITDNGEILAVPFSRSSQIWEMEPNGDARTAKQITSGQADGRAGLAALPEGRFAYIARIGDNLGVWTSSVTDRQPSQLTYEPFAAEEVRAAADGRFLVFSADRNGASDLYRIDPNGANLQQLTFGDGYNVDSTISPDGGWIVYTSQDLGAPYFKTTLKKIPATGGKPEMLADINCVAPHFSPDGRYISCVHENGKLAVVGVDGGAVERTFEWAKTPYTNCGAKWSPDGRSLFYIVRRQNYSNLWRQPLDGGAPEPLTDFTSGELHNFAFAPDGSRLYVARGYEVRDVILISSYR